MNNKEFKYSSKEDQEISTACKILIQNSIVLWNYLYLSELLANITDLEESHQMARSIVKGSIMSWVHINLQGEYDFTKVAANDNRFNMAKIFALQKSVT